MNGHTQLPIIGDQDSDPGCADRRTGLARALLPEIAESLAALSNANAESRIDLRSLPMTDADRSELAEMLGRGEVSMSITVAGQSDVFETGYAGVWWVRHRGVGGEIIAEHIEIARIPEIAVCHDDDIKRAERRLALRLADERDHNKEAQ